jgi:hypothetical protein
MSLATDVKSYADAAIEVAIGQTKQALDAAQAGLVKLQDNAKAIDPTVDSIKSAIEPTVDSIRAAIEPYLTMAKGYGSALSEKAESVVGEIKKDKRVTQVFDGTEALAVAVVAAVQDRVGKAASMAAATNPFAKPAAATVKPTAPATPTAVRKPATTKPTSTRPASTKPTSTKPAATPAAAKAAPATARKSAARKASSPETS